MTPDTYFESAKFRQLQIIISSQTHWPLTFYKSLQENEKTSYVSHFFLKEAHNSSETSSSQPIS